MITNLVDGLHHRRPVVIALEELGVEAGPLALLVGLGAAVLLDVQRSDALAQDTNPLLGPSVVDQVPHIEVPAHHGALEFIDVAGGLERAEEKIVPDVLNSDLHAQFLGQRHHLADLGLGPGVGVGVANGGTDHRRHQQHRRSTVGLGVTQRQLEPFHPDLADSRIWVGQRLGPVRVAAHRTRLETGGLQGGVHLGIVHATHRLDSIEACGLDGFHFLHHRARNPNGAPHDPLEDLALGGGLREGGQRSSEEGSGLKKMTAIHGNGEIGGWGNGSGTNTAETDEKKTNWAR